MVEKMLIPVKPKLLCNRLIREWDYGPYCPKCCSSLKTIWYFFRLDKCIQPECENYYGK